MQPIKQKKERALKVFEKLQETFDMYAQSTDENEKLAAKKTSRLIKNTEKKIEEEMKEGMSDKDYIQKVTEISGKVFDKLSSLDLDKLGDFLKDELEWMNEIKFIVLFDIDDTVRDASHRMDIRDEIQKIQLQRKEVEKGSDIETTMFERIDKLWDDFFIAGKHDAPRKDMIDLCNMYYDLGFEVKFRTGATAKYREETQNYLVSNGANFHELRMRKEGVKIPAQYLKPAWIPKYDGAENVLASYDDQAPVNERYKSKGVQDVILVGKDFDVKKHIEDMKEKIDKALVFINKESPDVAKKRKSKLTRK